MVSFSSLGVARETETDDVVADEVALMTVPPLVVPELFKSLIVAKDLESAS